MGVPPATSAASLQPRKRPNQNIIRTPGTGVYDRWHTTPFGTDTVFRRGGSLYDAGLRSRMEEFYNTSAGSAEFNALGNPLGFSTAPACVTGDDSTFVAVVDASVTAARADQLARLLIEGGFLHRRVRSTPNPSPLSLPHQLRV